MRTPCSRHTTVKTNTSPHPSEYGVALFIFIVCSPGTEGDGVTCADCILSYQPGGVSGNVSCTLCPPNTNAPNRATAASDCTGKRSSCKQTVQIYYIHFWKNLGKT